MESLFAVLGLILFIVMVASWCLYLIRRYIKIAHDIDKIGHDIDVNVRRIFGALAVIATLTFALWLYYARVFLG